MSTSDIEQVLSKALADNVLLSEVVEALLNNEFNWYEANLYDGGSFLRVGVAKVDTRGNGLCVVGARGFGDQRMDLHEVLSLKDWLMRLPETLPDDWDAREYKATGLVRDGIIAKHGIVLEG